MNILIYFPYNLRTVEQQSVMEMLVKQGHNLNLLTTCERGYLHDYVEKLGIKTDAVTLKSSAGKWRFYASNLRKLASVIEKDKIEVVVAHQQIPALLAGILRKIRSFKLVYIRHNSDEDYMSTPAKAKWLNKITNWLTPIKVAPSSVVEGHWVQQEKVAKGQIQRINYGYNFRQYESPNVIKVEEIKSQFPTVLRILSVARLVPAKRHKFMFEVISKLVTAGIDCKLICLGTGHLGNELQALVKQMGLTDHVFFPGRKENVFDYIGASDIFIHLSFSEASNSAVKEVGLCQKPVIVCKGVGDFEDYIIHEQNGFLVDKNDPVPETLSILKRMALGEIDPVVVGSKLFSTVTTKFDIANVGLAYEQLLKGKLIV